jgi:hypothetical protein
MRDAEVNLCVSSTPIVIPETCPSGCCSIARHLQIIRSKRGSQYYCQTLEMRLDDISVFRVDETTQFVHIGVSKY